jgi:hypothetical protein
MAHTEIPVCAATRRLADNSRHCLCRSAAFWFSLVIESGAKQFPRVAEDERFEVQPEMAARLVAKHLQQGDRFFALHIAFGHAVKSERAVPPLAEKFLSKKTYRSLVLSFLSDRRGFSTTEASGG